MPSEFRPGVLALALGLLTGGARATPPLTLPAWADLAAEPSGGWELGREAGLVIQLEARVGMVRVQPPALSGEGFRLLSGPSPAQAQSSTPGKPARYRFRLALDPTGPVRLEARMVAGVPQAAMIASLPAMYPGVPDDRLEELRDRIRALGPHQTLGSFVRPHLTQAEGFAPGDGARFELYLPVGRALFPLWDPPAPPGSGAAAAALGNASPRLARLLREAGVTAPAPGAGEYPGLLATLRSASPAVAASLADDFHGLAARPGIEGFAAGMAEAAALAMAGRTGEARARLAELAAGPGPTHYAHFALGELAAAAGALPEARAAYARAEAARPVLGIARRRLAELGSR